LNREQHPEGFDQGHPVQIHRMFFPLSLRGSSILGGENTRFLLKKYSIFPIYIREQS
jgi:hypothetical protein